MRLLRPVVRLATRARERWAWFDHLWRARDRYVEVHGARLAAAIAYYAFFAIWAAALAVFLVLGLALNDNSQPVIDRYLARNLPTLDLNGLRDARQPLGIIAAVGFVLAGARWVACVRSSVRAVWGLDRRPGPFGLRYLLDIAVLFGLAALLTVSLAITAAVHRGLTWLAHGTPVAGLADFTALLLGGFINALLAAALLTLVPRLRLPWRRVAWPAVLVANGLEVIRRLVAAYVDYAEANPAYHLVAGSVGLLVFMSLFHQLLLYAAALTATATTDTPGSPPTPREPESKGIQPVVGV